MKFTIIVVLWVVVGVMSEPVANATLIPMPDHATVYDTHLKVRWLADANLPRTQAGRFGVSGITTKGSMDYATALAWLAALNGYNDIGYLDHNNWTLPTTPTFPVTDPTCNATGPHNNSFGFGCKGSDLGSLFYISLGLQYPNTAVPIPDNTTGPFHNFQPYLYWTDTAADNNDSSKGFHTFSFNTGWSGGNVNGHFMYVLPMIPGNPFGTTATGNRLQLSADGNTVYDPVKDITWLANADLAKSMHFGAECTHEDGVQCINDDGSMRHSTALNWIDGMNQYNHGAGWLGQTHWQLPPDPGDCGEFGCDDSPLGRLFYSPDALGLSEGIPVVPTPDIDVGPFNHVQPYLYWSCSAPYTNPPCQNDPPAPGFQWSFSFGNGFQGTDVHHNDLYVMVYFPQSPGEALIDAINQTLTDSPELNSFLREAEHIRTAPNEDAEAGALQAFTNHVSAQTGKALSAEDAAELIALANAI